MKSMGLSTRLTVGSVISAIVLLSIFGVSRAFRSLNGSNLAEESTQSSRVDSFTSSNDPDDSQRTASQSNTEVPNVRTRNEEGELEYTPLQTAGTFIQRQQSLEVDPTVLDTEVSVLAVADGTAAQGNTIGTDQSDASGTDSSTNPESTSSTTPTTSPAVPALW